MTGRPFAQSDSRPLNVGWAVIYRALLIASGISESELRAIGRRHNDAGLTAAEAMSTRETFGRSVSGKRRTVTDSLTQVGLPPRKLDSSQEIADVVV